MYQRLWRRSFALTRLNSSKAATAAARIEPVLWQVTFPPYRPRTEVMADILPQGRKLMIVSRLKQGPFTCRVSMSSNGPQKALSPPVVRNVALLAAIGALYDLDIFVVCGILPLRKFSLRSQSWWKGRSTLQLRPHRILQVGGRNVLVLGSIIAWSSLLPIQSFGPRSPSLSRLITIILNWPTQSQLFVLKFP